MLENYYFMQLGEFRVLHKTKFEGDPSEFSIYFTLLYSFSVSLVFLWQLLLHDCDLMSMHYGSIFKTSNLNLSFFLIFLRLWMIINFYWMLIWKLSETFCNFHQKKVEVTKQNKNVWSLPKNISFWFHVTLFFDTSQARLRVHVSQADGRLLCGIYTVWERACSGELSKIVTSTSLARA